MSVLIKDMKIPLTCAKCNLKNAIECDRWKRVRSDILDRYKDCPLVPVSPHGRLIDADAISLDGGPYEYDEWCKWALEQYQDAPTVIEAEKE